MALPWPPALLLWGEHAPQQSVPTVPMSGTHKPDGAQGGACWIPKDRSPFLGAEPPPAQPRARLSHRCACSPLECSHSQAPNRCTHALQTCTEPSSHTAAGWLSPEREREPTGHSPRETRASCFGVCKNKPHPKRSRTSPVPATPRAPTDQPRRNPHCGSRLLQHQVGSSSVPARAEEKPPALVRLMEPQGLLPLPRH